jgi:hypothetical protein
MEAAPRHRACSGFHATKHARTVCRTSGKGSRPSIAVIALNVRCNQEQSYLCELPTGGLADEADLWNSCKPALSMRGPHASFL